MEHRGNEVDVGYSDFSEIATPSGNPASGALRFYAKSDHNYYQKTSAGVESQIGGITWVTPPTSPTSSGTAGQLARDSNFIYVCTATNTWTRVPLRWGVTLTYVSDGDANGVFYYLGSYVNGFWTNPFTTGYINLDASNLASGTLASVVDRVASDAFDDPQAGNWFSVDLGSNRSLICNKYSYRQRNSTTNFMTQMKLQGSNNGSSWVDLTTADSPTTGQNVWTSFTVTGSTAYRYFRILRTANDSGGSTYFTIGEWEIYGTLAV